MSTMRKNCTRNAVSVRRGRNWDPGLLAARYLGIVGLRAWAVVPVPFRMSRRRPFDVDRRFFYDDPRGGVVRRPRRRPKTGTAAPPPPPPRPPAHAPSRRQTDTSHPPAPT